MPHCNHLRDLLVEEMTAVIAVADEKNEADVEKLVRCPPNKCRVPEIWLVPTGCCNDDSRRDCDGLLVGGGKEYDKECVEPLAGGE